MVVVVAWTGVRAKEVGCGGFEDVLVEWAGLRDELAMGVDKRDRNRAIAKSRGRPPHIPKPVTHKGPHRSVCLQSLVWWECQQIRCSYYSLLLIVLSGIPVLLITDEQSEGTTCNYLLSVLPALWEVGAGWGREPCLPLMLGSPEGLALEGIPCGRVPCGHFPGKAPS